MKAHKHTLPNAEIGSHYYRREGPATATTRLRCPGRAAANKPPPPFSSSAREAARQSPAAARTAAAVFSSLPSGRTLARHELGHGVGADRIRAVASRSVPWWRIRPSGGGVLTSRRGLAVVLAAATGAMVGEPGGRRSLGRLRTEHGGAATTDAVEVPQERGDAVMREEATTL